MKFIADNPIVFLIALFIFILISCAIREHNRWENFKKDHNCKVIEEVDSSVGIGSGISTNGEFVSTTVYIPGKECWLCDDGKKYWRDK